MDQNTPHESHAKCGIMIAYVKQKKKTCYDDKTAKKIGKVTGFVAYNSGNCSSRANLGFYEYFCAFQTC